MAEQSFEELGEKLRGKLFLSSMMHVTSGKWCAEYGKGAAMVQLGAFVTSRSGSDDPWWLPPDRAGMVECLKREVDDFQKSFEAEPVPLLCANMYPADEETVEDSAVALKQAGADIYELNAHGGTEDYRQQGTGHALFFPENISKLYRWVGKLLTAGIPVIVKARAHVIPDYSEHIKRFAEMGTFAFHINIRDEKERGMQSLDVVKSIRQATDAFLLASGYVKDAASARALFDAGADCVGIAAAVRGEPKIFLKLREG